MEEEIGALVTTLCEAKKVIIEEWVATDSVQSILKKYISLKLFIDQYASSIFDYFVAVLENRAAIGDCPTVHKFLHYCSEENITSEEIYLICSGFRNSTIEYLLRQDLLSLQLYQKTVYIFDQNFSGILTLYTKMLKEKNEKLIEQSLWLEQYAEIIDKVLIVSKTDTLGIITYVNENFCKISGYSKEELLGKPHNIIRHEDMPAETFKELWETIEAKKPWMGVLKNRGKDGSPYFVSTVIFPILDKQGNIIEYMSTRTDLTELCALEREKKQQESLLIQQAKMAEMGEMLSVIIHQWNQPLSIILMSADMILTAIEDLTIESDIDIEQRANVIVEQASLMNQTTHVFRNFFRPSLKDETFMACEIAIEAYQLVESKFKMHNIAFEVEEHEHFRVKGSVNEFRQVILNLYNNACDMFIENGIQDGKLRLGFKQGENVATIHVYDNGGGIDEQLLPDRLFEHHVSTKGEKGTGIGLYLSRLIIEKKMDGHISARNSNSGAEFVIELPLDKE